MAEQNDGIANGGVDMIEVFSRWTGFADPPHLTAKLVIRPAGTGYERDTGDASSFNVIPSGLVTEFLGALGRDSVPQLDPALFDLPPEVLTRHYRGFWTDDHPELLVRVRLRLGSVVTIRSAAQHAFMLPLEVARGDGGAPAGTFDPRLSRAIARLMPAGFLHRDRLAGRSGMLQLDLDMCEGLVEESAEAAEEEGADAPPERRPADPRAGRLLKRIPMDEVRQLLTAGVNPDAADDVGQTALMHAAFPPPDLDRFCLLVSAGANLEARRRDGGTGLHLACAGGMAEVARAWVDAGADVNARTTRERATPLMAAVRWPRIVAMLLDAGADVNARDAAGDSALAHLVSDHSWPRGEAKLRIARALLDAGAEASRANARGETPVMLAERALARARTDHDVAGAFGEPEVFENDSLIPGRDVRPPEEAAAMALVDLLTSHPKRRDGQL